MKDLKCANTTKAGTVNVDIANEPEAKEVLEMMKELTPEEKKEMVNFAHGVKFGKQLAKEQ